MLASCGGGGSAMGPGFSHNPGGAFPSPLPTGTAAGGSVTETGTVANVNPYGPDTPMLVLHPGSPYDNVDVYLTGTNNFRVGQSVVAHGTYVNSPPNHWIQASSVTLSGSSPGPSPAPTNTPTVRPSATPRPSSTPSATPRPSPTATSNPGTVDHIFVIVMENHSRSSIVGNAAAPYINNTLLPNSANMTSSFGVDHPSEPNYEALYSGSEQGLSGTDACPVTFSTPSLGGELGAQFRWYAEDMQGVGNPACWQGANDADGNPLYGRKHVVMFNHTDTPANDGVPYTELAGDLANNTVPRAAFISPNQCDDMHDSCGGSSVAHGDSWLANNLPALEGYSNSHNGMVIVTWDEDEYASGQIATFIVGPMVKNGSYGEHIDHYNILATICRKLGLTNLGSSAITDIFR